MAPPIFSPDSILAARYRTIVQCHPLASANLVAPSLGSSAPAATRSPPSISAPSCVHVCAPSSAATMPLKHALIAGHSDRRAHSSADP